MRQLTLTTVAIKIVITDDTGQLETIILSLKSLLSVLFVVSQVVLGTMQFFSIVIEGFNDTVRLFMTAFKLLTIDYSLFSFAIG